MKLRSLTPLAAAAFAALLPLAAPAASPWDGWPDWLEAPAHVADAEYLPGMDPAAVDWDAAEATRRGILATLASDGPVAALGAAAKIDDVLVRERIIVDLCLQLEKDGDARALPPLDALAAAKPLSAYLAPGCKQPHRHILFDTQRAAGIAADKIRFRDGYSAATARATRDASALREALVAERHPARLAGALAASGDGVGALAKDATFLEELERPQAEALVVHLRRSGNAAALLDVASTIDGRLASRAVEAIGAAREGVDAAQLQALAQARHEVAPSVLAILGAGDREALPWLEGLLSNEALGAGAAQALQRVDAVAAREAAERALASGDAVAARRALLMLMNDGGDEARAIVAAFAQSDSSDASMQRLHARSAQWLSE